MSVLALLAGALIGVSLGALGGGGAILAVPALVYLVGQGPKEATTGSLVIVGTTALITAINQGRSGRVMWGQGALFGVLGIGGTYVGGKLASGLDEKVLTLSFAALLPLVAVLMWRRASKAGGTGPEGDALWTPMMTFEPTFTCACKRVAAMIATASFVGLVTGFFGVGGGFVVVPALTMAMGFAPSVAVGTSLLVIAINSATALAGRLSHGVELDWMVIGSFTVMALIGGVFGSKLSAKMDAKTIQKAFAGFLIFLALFMVVDTLLLNG